MIHAFNSSFNEADLSLHKMLELLRSFKDEFYPEALKLTKATKREDKQGTDYWILLPDGIRISVDKSDP